MGRYVLRLNGPFRFTAPDGKEIRIGSQKSRAMLACLAAAPGGQRERKSIREMLWERSGPAQQRASLSQELKTLRGARSLRQARDPCYRPIG